MTDNKITDGLRDAQAFAQAFARGDVHKATLTINGLRQLIADTPHLEWLLLTKRPENWPLFLPVAEPQPPFRNIRLGVTIEDQPRFDQRGSVLQFAADLVSYEPVLGDVDWTPAFEGKAIGWMISGGESGPRSRISPPDRFRKVRDLCAAHGVPYLHKQNGEWVPCTQADGHVESEKERLVDGTWMLRVGKKHAGRLLDGVEHNGMPEITR